MLSDCCAIAYLLASYIPKDWPISEYAGMMGELSWLALHVGTGLIYLCFNASVRLKIKACVASGMSLTSASAVPSVMPHGTR
ncbi:hypothetical protein L596_020263 [Steinernema carpocapsae]|uniref:Uncharacterized protein n=1 Tax=Steinernema carpocapsae TaxID=34508 RepID=A0A4U5MT09_STECR|nr:hypothetical protein L596_020263 [Steinernema carpocapsae]